MRSNKYLREKWKGSIFFPQTCTALAKHYQGVSFQILRFHIFAQNYLEIDQFHVICAWYIKRFCVNTFNNCLWPCTLTWCQKVCWPCPEGKVSDPIWARAYIGTHHTFVPHCVISNHGLSMIFTHLTSWPLSKSSNCRTELTLNWTKYLQLASAKRSDRIACEENPF